MFNSCSMKPLVFCLVFVGGLIQITLPGTNSSPLKTGHSKMKVVFQPSIKFPHYIIQGVYIGLIFSLRGPKIPRGPKKIPKKFSFSFSPRMDDPKHGAYSRYESLGQASHPVSGDTMLLGDPVGAPGPVVVPETLKILGTKLVDPKLFGTKKGVNYKHIFIVWFTPYAN